MLRSCGILDRDETDKQDPLQHLIWMPSAHADTNKSGMTARKKCPFNFRRCFAACRARPFMQSCQSLYQWRTYQRFTALRGHPLKVWSNLDKQQRRMLFLGSKREKPCKSLLLNMGLSAPENESSRFPNTEIGPCGSLRELSKGTSAS